MSSNSGLYAYGLMAKRPLHPGILGVDKKHGVYPIAEHDVCVIVSNIDIDAFQHGVKQLFSSLTINTENRQGEAQGILQAHEDVVEALMKIATIVPFKFGTILKDEKAASTMLQDEQEKFRKLLAKCTGRTEWGLKIYVDRQACLQQRLQGEPAFKQLAAQRATLSNGAAYLLGRKMEEEGKNRVTAWLTGITEGMFQGLAKDAYEATLHESLPQKLTGKKKEMVLNAAFLVAEENVANFCQQGKSLQDHYEAIGVDVELSGPWPPYSFV